MPTPDLSGLIERLERATGPDRELDVWLAMALERPTTLLNGQTFSEAVAALPNDLHGIARHWPIEPLTASLDAALALVERVRPGEWIEVSGPRKYLYIPAPVPNHWLAVVGDSRGWGFTPALALCLALLRTLEPQHG